MKLYLPQKLFNIDKISNLEYNRYTLDTIYSNEGIFKIKKNKNKREIRKVEIVDKQVEYIQLNHSYFNLCLVDHSTENILETVYRIPVDHILETEYIKKYTLRNGCMVSLICVYDNKNTFKYLYFELRESLKYKFVMDDIYSFLSLLN